MISRIGIMGGMFDPVHNGHIEAALTAVRLLDLDELRMVPCGTPNHRNNASCSSEQRLEMLKLATLEYPSIAVDPCELDRPGVSYTYDTLVSIKQEPGSSILFFVLGADAFFSLPHWHRWQELFNYSHFVVLNRAGVKVDGDTLISQELEERRVDNAGDLLEQESGKIFFLNDFAFDLSSTNVRNKIEAGHLLESDLAPAVASYIIENKLYGIKLNKANERQQAKQESTS